MNSDQFHQYPKTLYFSSSKGIGFTYHLSEFACNIGINKNFLFVSGELEQFPGIFSKLNLSNINRATIPSLDTSKNITKHLSELKSIIDNFQPNVIHTQTNYQLILASILKPFYKFKIVQTIHAFEHSHGGAKMRLAKWYLTVMCTLFVKKVIFQSSYVKNNFKSLIHKSCDLAMGFETPLAIDHKKYSHPLQIIYSAKFRESKNHKWLITSLEPLLLKNLVNLIIPGDGECFQSIEQLVLDKKLSNQVKLPGWINRNEMASAYNKAHLAIVPSRSETLGHNIIEPLAYGIPVISFPVGIAPDIAEKSNAVKLVQFYAADEMIKAIEQHLYNTTFHEETAKEASDYFHKNLTWDIYVERYKNLLNTL